MSPYDDIINLPHHQSPARAHMPLGSRATQFAPFAALTGYGAAVTETARLTDRKPCLAEGKQEELNLALRIIEAALPRLIPAEITWFIPDSRKAGGSIRSRTAQIRKIDPVTQTLILEAGLAIPMENLLDLKIQEIGALL